MDADVRADAAGLRLLSGDGAAALAAICRLVAAADLCVRGHAVAVDRPCVSLRPDDRGARHQRGAVYCVICGIPCAFEERTAPWLADPGWRISHLSKDLRDLFLVRPVDIPICIDALLRIRHYAAMQNGD